MVMFESTKFASSVVKHWNVLIAAGPKFVSPKVPGE